MKKAVGIVRNLDDLGRVVIPKEISDRLGIKEKDPIGIYVDDDGEIILMKYNPVCIFCKGEDDGFKYMDKNICDSCLDNIESQRKEQ